MRPLIETLRYLKIDDWLYFGRDYSDYVSNSRLSLLERGPDAFFNASFNQYSDSLYFGSLLHQIVLQPDRYELCETVNRPTAKAGFMADYLYNSIDVIGDIDKASKEIGYYRDSLNDDKVSALLEKCEPYWQERREYESQKHDKTPLYADAKTRDRIHECLKCLNEDKDIQNLLHPTGILTSPISDNEQAILIDIQDEDAILHFKAKLDNYSIDLETNTIIVNDLKTIGPAEFKDNFNKYHYYRELALYSWLLSLVADRYYNMENCTIKANCLVVSTIPKYYTKIYQVTASDFKRGWEEFKDLMGLVFHYYKQGWRLTKK